jgi:hypothetical protein
MGPEEARPVGILPPPGVCFGFLYFGYLIFYLVPRCGGTGFVIWFLVFLFGSCFLVLGSFIWFL